MTTIRDTNNSTAHNGIPAVPLSMALVGQTVVLASVAGDEIGLRLAEMGLTPGEEIQILNRGPGPFIILVRGSKLLLGRGTVETITIRPKM
jgi:Fe2+ transport system protein FeoA